MIARHGRASQSALKRLSQCFSCETPRYAAHKSAQTTPKKRGRPRKLQPTVDDCKRTAPRAQKQSAATPQHSDLSTFLAHASSGGTSISSTVYKGTYYEYLVAQTLRAYSFDLERVGQANDLGIDLLGSWSVPAPELNSDGQGVGATKCGQRALNVLVQCKATAPTPSMIRELEGAYAGAPAGWQVRDDGAATLGFLVCNGVATKGTREAVQRSQLPLAFLQIGYEDGVVRQFLWNAVAKRMGLEGLGVTMSFGGADGDHGAAALTWMGELWKSHRQQDSPND